MSHLMAPRSFTQCTEIRGGAGFYNGSSCERLHHLIEPTRCKIGFATGGQTLAFVLVVFRFKKKKMTEKKSWIYPLYMVIEITCPQERFTISRAQSCCQLICHKDVFFLAPWRFFNFTRKYRGFKEGEGGCIACFIFVCFTSIFDKEKKKSHVFEQKFYLCA